MADDPLDGSLKRDETDKVASEACTRSGAFALLVSVLLFVLCGSWHNRKAEEALAVYISDRLNLAMYLEELQKDKLWQEYTGSHPDADQKPFAELIHASVERTDTQAKFEFHKVDDVPRRSAEPQTSNSSSKAPAPAGPLTARFVSIVELYEMPLIAQFWQKLNDSDLLSRSQETSNYNNFPLSKWVNRRSRVMYSNALTGVCTASEIETPRRLFKSTRYVPQMNNEALMNCITFRDLRELAQFELPQMPDPFRLGGRIVRDVDLSPGSFPKDLYAASLVAQALLFFTLFYFSAFAREAVSTESFPTRGTLFGAFSRTRWMLMVFLLALWTPFLACCAVAFASGKVLLGLAAAPVLFATCSAQRTLEGKAFFGSVRPFAFLAAQYGRITGN